MAVSLVHIKWILVESNTVCCCCCWCYCCSPQKHSLSSILTSDFFYSILYCFSIVCCCYVCKTKRTIDFGSGDDSSDFIFKFGCSHSRVYTFWSFYTKNIERKIEWTTVCVFEKKKYFFNFIELMNKSVFFTLSLSVCVPFLLLGYLFSCGPFPRRNVTLNRSFSIVLRRCFCLCLNFLFLFFETEKKFTFNFTKINLGQQVFEEKKSM